MKRLAERFGRVAVLIGAVAMLFGGKAEAFTLTELETVQGIISQLTSSGTGAAFSARFDGDLVSPPGAHPAIHFGADDLTGFARYNNLLNTFSLTFSYAGALENGAGIGGTVTHSYQQVQTLLLGGRAYLVSYAPATNDGVLDATIWTSAQQNGLNNLNLDGVEAPNSFGTVPSPLASYLQSTGQSIFFFLELAPEGAISAWFRTPNTFNLNVAGLSGAHRFENLVLNGHLTRGGAEVPEPATAALLGLGLMGLRRRRNAA